MPTIKVTKFHIVVCCASSAFVLLLNCVKQKSISSTKETDIASSASVKPPSLELVFPPIAPADPVPNGTGTSGNPKQPPAQDATNTTATTDPQNQDLTTKTTSKTDASPTNNTSTLWIGNDATGFVTLLDNAGLGITALLQTAGSSVTLDGFMCDNSQKNCTTTIINGESSIAKTINNDAFSNMITALTKAGIVANKDGVIKANIQIKNSTDNGISVTFLQQP